MTPSAATKKCVRCEAQLSVEALWGLCAKCLFNEAEALPAREDVPGSGSRRFGGYELGEAVGRGGMGVVYQATHVGLHRTVALKMILESEACSPSSRRRFTLEAEAAARLDHPNIVPIYEVGEHEGRPFLSMKLIAGENLRTKISSGALCLTPKTPTATSTGFRERALAVVRTVAIIARAVHHAHQHSILHRDLKPANILVDLDGQPHVTDFGLAKVMELAADDSTPGALTVSGTALGTPSYMSPEQAEGKRLTAAADIYSLGVILYEMLAGTPPFRAGTALETLKLAAEQEARRPSAINPRIDRDLDTICLKCLEKNPQARYRTAEGLAEDLERWLRQEPIHARPASIPLRIHRWVARNRLGTALIVSLCGGLTVALLLLEQARARQEKLDLHHAHNVKRLMREVEEMWRNPDQQFALVQATTLGELVDLPPRRINAVVANLTLALSINSEPLGQAFQYAPFLNALEQRIEKRLGSPVAIDLRLYKSEAEAAKAAEQGRVDIQRMSSLVYVLSERSTPGREPLARERSRNEAVVFASRRSGITNLQQVKGRRIAFGQTNSTISFWGKVRLQRAGIHARDFQTIQHCSGTKQDRDPDPARPKGSEERESETQAHRRAIEAVSLNEADVGVAPRLLFELNRYRKGGLVELCNYSFTPHSYVARPGLNTNVIQAFREALASFQSREDRKLLAHLVQNINIQGFDPVTSEDFDDIRSALSHEHAEFEAGVADSSPAGPREASR